MFLVLGTVFVASLVGSLHCVGMCGPLALVASAGRRDGKPSMTPVVAYSVGRLCSYAIVGALAGTMGMALSQSAALVSWQRSATYVAGSLMILVGTIALARCIGFAIRIPGPVGRLQHLLQAGFRKTKQMSPLWRAASIGALSSLMPCGWLYTFAITAAGTASPIYGALLMTVFWAGTVPALVAFTLGVNKLGSSFKKHIPVTMAVLVIAVGVFTIVYRAPVDVSNSPVDVVSGGANLVQQVRDIDHEQLPCCSGDRP